MFSAQTYTSRRAALRAKMDNGVVLFPGNNEMPYNYRANTYKFRQDSNFLYFFGIDHHGLMGAMDLDAGEDILFADELTMEDVVWVGPQLSYGEQAERVGIHTVHPKQDLAGFIKNAQASGRMIHFAPPYRHDNMILLSTLTGTPVADLGKKASVELIKAIVALRSYKTSEEIAEMEYALDLTGQMHRAAMQYATAGKKEAYLAGIVEGIAASVDSQMAYGIILSTNGQTLHNHYHGNVMQEGQLVLGDFGCASLMHYAADITRTFPVSKTFTQKQKDIYNIVLKAEEDSIAACKPNVSYQKIHLDACRIIGNGLKALGLMKGNIDSAVEQGAHALFMPHGLGHMIGLDVHDMEDLGENYVGYSDTVKRSELFGTAYLRLGRALEKDFVLTVEPGIYFIPELIDQWRNEGKFKDFINYDKLDAYRDFGGIRIEDNVLVTEQEPRVLGTPIPKTVEEVEAERATFA